MSTLQPAYGRDYKSRAAVLKDFLAGKDFRLADMFDPHDGRLINRPQVEESGRTSVVVRYKKNRSSCTLKKKGDTWITG